MKTFTISLFLLVSILGANSTTFHTAWFDQLAHLNLAANDKVSNENTPKFATLDEVTYVLVDTSLFLMQVGKSSLWFAGYADGQFIGIGPLFDWTFSTTRVKCESSCVQEDIHMELRELYIWGLNTRTIQLNTDIQPTKLNLTLTVGELALDSPTYRHTITNNASGIVRMGENATFSIKNATYGISADYKIVHDVGIQVSNVDITFDIGEESWTVERTYSVLENGEIVEHGLYQADLKEGVMNTWKSENENGELFEKKYEERAEFLINCGLSGRRSSEACKDVKEQVEKYKLMAKNQSI